jgi:hypothetical protein
LAVHSKGQVRFPGRPLIEVPLHLADEHSIYLKAHILSKGLILVDLPGEWNTLYIVSLLVSDYFVNDSRPSRSQHSSLEDHREIRVELR